MCRQSASPAIARARDTRLFGLHVIVAYALAAIIGDIHRFRTPKKLAAYLGSSPSVNRSGIGEHDGGSVPWGCGETRRILIQAAKVILGDHKDSPIWRWGLGLAYRNGRNLAALAVVRKLVVAVWYLLKGVFSPLTEPTPLLRRKRDDLGEEIGLKRLRAIGFKTFGLFREEKLKILMATA